MAYDAARYFVAMWLEGQEVIEIIGITDIVRGADGKVVPATRFLNWSDIVMFALGSIFAMVAPVFKWMFFYTSFKAVFNLTGYDLTTIILDSVKLVI